jgi:putative phage-type endonuclease
MKVIDIEQRSLEWLMWRARGVSASDAAVILGLSDIDVDDDGSFGDGMVSPYKTPWRLWGEKTGLLVPQDISQNPNVKRGIALEGPAIADFEERHGVFTLPLCVESSEHPEIRASLDGLTDHGEVVEIKVPTPRRYLEVLNLGVQSPAYKLYWPQVQTQIYVAGADKAWLVFYQGQGVRHEFEVARDERFIADQLVPAMLEFWELVKTRKAPELDHARDLFIPEGLAHDTWTALAGEYRKLAPELKALEALMKSKKERLDAIRDEFTAMMGEFMLAETAGVRVARFNKAGPVEWRQLVADRVPDIEDAEIEAYRKAGSMQARVTVQKEERATVPFDGDAVQQAQQEQADASGWF